MSAAPGAVGAIKVAPPEGDGVVEATGVCTLPRAVVSLAENEGANDKRDTLLAAGSNPSLNVGGLEHEGWQHWECGADVNESECDARGG